MPISLTDSEQKLLAAVISQMEALPAVDYQLVGNEVGITYARNARSSFKKVWEKLKGNANTPRASNAPNGMKSPTTPTRSPIKKKNAGGTAQRNSEPRNIRPTRDRKKSERAIAAEKLKMEYPSDEDEAMTKEEPLDEQMMYHGTPDTLPDTQRNEEDDEEEEYQDVLEDNSAHEI